MLTHVCSHCHSQTHTQQHIPTHKDTLKHTPTASSSHTLTHTDLHIKTYMWHTHIQSCTIVHKTKTHMQISLYCALRGAFWQCLDASQSNAPTMIHCLSKHSWHPSAAIPTYSQSYIGNGFWCILLWMAQRLWNTQGRSIVSVKTADGARCSHMMICWICFTKSNTHMNDVL